MESIRIKRIEIRLRSGLGNYESQCAQDKRDLLAGMLCLQKAEGNFVAKRHFVSVLEKTMVL